MAGTQVNYSRIRWREGPTNRPIISHVGSFLATLRDVWIVTDEIENEPTYPALCGILNARHNNGTKVLGADRHHFERICLVGTFHAAALCDVTAEVNTYINVLIENRSQNLNSYGYLRVGLVGMRAHPSHEKTFVLPLITDESPAHDAYTLKDLQDAEAAGIEVDARAAGYYYALPVYAAGAEPHAWCCSTGGVWVGGSVQHFGGGHAIGLWNAQEFSMRGTHVYANHGDCIQFAHSAVAVHLMDVRCEGTRRVRFLGGHDYSVHIDGGHMSLVADDGATVRDSIIENCLLRVPGDDEQAYPVDLHTIDYSRLDMRGEKLRLRYSATGTEISDVGVMLAEDSSTVKQCRITGQPGSAIQYPIDLYDVFNCDIDARGVPVRIRGNYYGNTIRNAAVVKLVIDQEMSDDTVVHWLEPAGGGISRGVSVQPDAPRMYRTLKFDAEVGAVSIAGGSSLVEFVAASGLTAKDVVRGGSARLIVNNGYVFLGDGVSVQMVPRDAGAITLIWRNDSTSQWNRPAGTVRVVAEIMRF
jgi:hypothetical protein